MLEGNDGLLGVLVVVIGDPSERVAKHRSPGSAADAFRQFEELMHVVPRKLDGGKPAKRRQVVGPTCQDLVEGWYCKFGMGPSRQTVGSELQVGLRQIASAAKVRL